MNINIIRGDTNIITFTLKNGDNNYILQTGDKLTFTVKQTTAIDRSVISKTYGNGITYNSITGKYEITLDGSCSCELKSVAFVYDIEFVSANGNVKTLASGEFNLSQDCTKPCNRGVS